MAAISVGESSFSLRVESGGRGAARPSAGVDVRDWWFALVCGRMGTGSGNFVR